MSALYRRFRSLDPADRRLVLQAASLMALVWTGLRLVRFPTLRLLLHRYMASPAGRAAGPHGPAATRPVSWAITTVAARFPGATCLVQALAADAILRRRGFASEVCIGVRVRRDSALPLEAHAWVECDGAVAIGAIDNLSEFRVLSAPRPQPAPAFGLHRR